MKTKQHRWWRKKTFQNKRQKVQQTLLSRQNKSSFQTVEFEKGLNSFWVSIFLICATYMSTSDTDSCDLIFVFIVTHDCCCVLILFCVFSFRAWIFFFFSVFCRYLKHVLFDIWSGRTLFDKTQMQLGIKVSRGDTVVKSSFNSQTVRSLNRQLILISIICVERVALSLRLKQLTCVPTEYWSKTTQYVLINFWSVLKFNIFYLKYSISVLVDFSRLSDINIFLCFNNFYLKFS